MILPSVHLIISIFASGQRQNSILLELNFSVLDYVQGQRVKLTGWVCESRRWHGWHVFSAVRSSGHAIHWYSRLVSFRYIFKQSLWLRLRGSNWALVNDPHPPPTPTRPGTLCFFSFNFYGKQSFNWAELSSPLAAPLTLICLGSTQLSLRSAHARNPSSEGNYYTTGILLA